MRGVQKTYTLTMKDDSCSTILKIDTTSLSDHPLLIIESNCAASFFSRNVFCPGTGISTAVLNAAKLNNSQNPNARFREMPGTSNQRLSLLAESNLALLKDFPFGILQEVPNLTSDHFNHLTSGLTSNQIKSLKDSWVSTDKENKFGLAVIAQENVKVKLIQNANENDSIQSILTAIQRTEIGNTQEAKTQKAALYEITIDNATYHVVNLHTDWTKPIETAELIQAALKANYLVGGDTNIQTLRDAGIDPNNQTDDKKTDVPTTTPKPSNLNPEYNTEAKDPNAKRKEDLIKTHSILDTITNKQQALLAIVGNTIDLIGSTLTKRYNVHDEFKGELKPIPDQEKEKIQGLKKQYIANGGSRSQSNKIFGDASNLTQVLIKLISRAMQSHLKKSSSFSFFSRKKTETELKSNIEAFDPESEGTASQKTLKEFMKNTSDSIKALINEYIQIAKIEAFYKKSGGSDGKAIEIFHKTDGSFEDSDEIEKKLTARKDIQGLFHGASKATLEAYGMLLSQQKPSSSSSENSSNLNENYHNMYAAP